MAADGEEVLMSDGELDRRGPQSRIGRLRHFHMEGFIHSLFYRILIPVSIVYGGIIILWLFLPALALAVKALTAVVWVLFVPQLFEVVKGLVLARSRGMVFGRLNREFAELYRVRYGKPPAYLVAAPYIVLAVWIIGFVAMVLWWWP